MLPADDGVDKTGRWWDCASSEGHRRFKYWVRLLHGRGYGTPGSRGAAIGTFRLWQAHSWCCTRTGASFKVTPESVVAFINWWQGSPDWLSYKPHDTMKGYLKHLAHLQFMQQAVQLDTASLKSAKPTSLFDDEDVQDLLSDLQQKQECIQLGWVATLWSPCWCYCRYY